MGKTSSIFDITHYNKFLHELELLANAHAQTHLLLFLCDILSHQALAYTY